MQGRCGPEGARRQERLRLRDPPGALGPGLRQHLKVRHRPDGRDRHHPGHGAVLRS